MGKIARKYSLAETPCHFSLKKRSHHRTPLKGGRRFSEKRISFPPLVRKREEKRSSS
jgi:hypothetical protein